MVCVALSVIITVAEVEVMFVMPVLLVVVWARGIVGAKVMVELALTAVAAGSVEFEVGVMLALVSVMF